MAGETLKQKERTDATEKWWKFCHNQKENVNVTPVSRAPLHNQILGDRCFPNDSNFSSSAIASRIFEVIKIYRLNSETVTYK
jgi:hypothetical protein